MRDIFETYNLSELRKLASGYNKKVKIAGASKMKKPDLIDALMKHTQFFKDVKKKVAVVKPTRKPTTKPPAPKPQPKSTPKAPEPKPQPKLTPKAPEPKPQPKSKPKAVKKIDNRDRAEAMTQRLLSEESLKDLKNYKIVPTTDEPKYKYVILPRDDSKNLKFQRFFFNTYNEILNFLKKTKKDIDVYNKLSNSTGYVNVGGIGNFLKLPNKFIKKGRFAIAGRPAFVFTNLEEFKARLEIARSLDIRPKTTEPKPQSKLTGPTMNDFINEYDTASSIYVLMQYDVKTYIALDKFLRRIIKKNSKIDLDQFLASGVYLSNELIKKIILKYGIKKTFEYTEDLLKNIVSDEDLKIIVAPEALTNINKNRTATKIFKGNLKNVKF